MSNVKNMMCTTLTRSMPAIAFFGRMAFALVFIISAIQDYADHFGGGGGPLERTVGPGKESSSNSFHIRERSNFFLNC
ncbi:hypothetical protein Bca52824_026450 [Brassica carinata]|uniref:Uncharacterized protein n=1 Tax=Brassica carinata TaxID=52824 RepID=A0A8X7SIM0_BRACI|nr:hypothetical protein Bca52824_026450 [Brassica carinata]